MQRFDITEFNWRYSIKQYNYSRYDEKIERNKRTGEGGGCGRFREAQSGGAGGGRRFAEAARVAAAVVEARVQDRLQQVFVLLGAPAQPTHLRLKKKTRHIPNV